MGHSAYSEFLKEYRPKLLKENPTLSNSEVSIKCAEMWSALPEDEKRRYQDIANANKDRIKRSMLCSSTQMDSLPFYNQNNEPSVDPPSENTTKNSIQMVQTPVKQAPQTPTKQPSQTNQTSSHTSPVKNTAVALPKPSQNQTTKIPQVEQSNTKQLPKLPTFKLELDNESFTIDVATNTNSAPTAEPKDIGTQTPHEASDKSSSQRKTEKKTKKNNNNTMNFAYPICFIPVMLPINLTQQNQVFQQLFEQFVPKKKDRSDSSSDSSD